MATDKNSKLEIINNFKIHDTDTGSCAVQIAILTARIRELTTHLNAHKKDFHSRVGLIKMIERRKKCLKYIKERTPEEYFAIIKRLNIRK